jgi:hypothetical protein
MNSLARYTPLLKPISSRKLAGISGIWKLSITGGTVLSYKTNMIDGNIAGDGTPLSGTSLN